MDEIIAAYKRDVDRTLLAETARMTTQQRSERFAAFMELCFELRKNATATVSRPSESAEDRADK